MEKAQRLQKQATVASLKESMASANLVVMTHNKGLTVDQVTTLRNKARAEGVKIKVSKNSLTKLAIKDTPFAQLEQFLAGPTVLNYSEDSVAAAKVAVQFAKDNERLVILGGTLNEKLLSEDEVKALAELPSLDALRGKIIGLLQAPATKIACILQAPGGQVARVINAYATKDA